MDRNQRIKFKLDFVNQVALRKESVDRNRVAKYRRIPLLVALRKESVDRNYIIKITQIAPRRSLSARRAWIEIRGGYITKIDKDQSLSARRAWIEIIERSFAMNPKKNSRSPQGERG